MAETRKRSVAGSGLCYQQQAQLILNQRKSGFFPVSNSEGKMLRCDKRATKTPLQNDNNISNLKFMNELQCDLKTQSIYRQKNNKNESGRRAREK